jgi:HSP20 family protein
MLSLVPRYAARSVPAAFRDFDRLFDISGLRERVGLIPSLALQVSEHADFYRVSAEVPGARKEELKVVIREDIVTIGFQRSAPASDTAGAESGKVVYADRSAARAERSVQLPEELAESGHEAKLENGVLELKLIKRTPRRAESIEVTIQ